MPALPWQRAPTFLAKSTHKSTKLDTLSFQDVVTVRYMTILIYIVAHQTLFSLQSVEEFSLWGTPRAAFEHWTLCIPHLEHLAARPNWFCHSGANRSPCSLLDYWLVSKSDGTHSYIQRPYIYRHIICISWHGCTSIVVHIKSWYSTVPQNESSPIPWQLSVCLNPKIPHLRPGAKWHVGLEG